MNGSPQSQSPLIVKPIPEASTTSAAGRKTRMT